MSQSPNPAKLDPASANLAAKEIVSQSEIEQLLAQVESVDPSTEGIGSKSISGSELVRRHEFPKISFYSSADLRRLRMRHEDFISSLAARISLHSGMELAMQMSKLDSTSFQAFIDSLSNPSYVTMLKFPPLKGIALLDIPPRLGLCIVDRELGGPGRAADETCQIGKIEARLLARIVDLIAQEWCGLWRDVLELRSTVAGTESNSRFLTTSTPTTNMLVVGIEARLVDAVETIQFAFPHSIIEPLAVKLNGEANGGDKPDAVAKGAPSQWGPFFNDIDIEVKAELPGIRLAADQLAGLKAGDVLTLPSELMQQVQLRLENKAGFVGVLGSCDLRRAVKIERLA